MRKLSCFVFTILIAAFCGSSSGTAASLATNGGFETGDLIGWSVTGSDSAPIYNGIYYGVDAADAHSGAYGAYFGPPGGILTLSQSISTAPGLGYTVSFWLAQDTAVSTGYINSLTVLLGSSTAYSSTNIPVEGYTLYSVYGVASTASDTLRLNFRNDTGFFSLDDVSVTSGTPEPASLLLIAPALSGLLFFRRYKFSR